MASNSAVHQQGMYFPSWINMEPSSIKTELFTHLYYAFLTPDAATFTFKIEQTEATRIHKFTSTLRKKAPTLKILFSVGDATGGTTLFKRLASTGTFREAFIQSSIKVAREYGFDGVDLVWKFPESPEDMANFGLLLKDLRAGVQKDAADNGNPPLLLAAAVYYSVNTPHGGVYPAALVAEKLDWINVISYDYYGSWDTTKTGAPAALRDPNSNKSSDYGLRSWIGAGVQPIKLIMGLPLYGRTWKLKDPKINGIGAPAVGVGPGDGTLTYAKVVDFNRKYNADVKFDNPTESTYSVAGDSWIGYDDENSVGTKIGYAKDDLGLGGYFLYAIDGDHNWTISETASSLWHV